MRRVTKVYPGGHVGLERVSLRVDRGEFVFLVGPTGCGKTTLIKTLIRELEPTEGEVLIAGRDISTLPDKKVPQLRRRIGTVFQDFKLLPSRSVYDNVAYALQVIGASRAEIRRKVPDALRLVGLADKVRSFPDQLSGGEQQRLSVARAFVNHPPLLLADEPTGNLDPNTSIGIMQVLYRINRTGTTVVVVTHDREMVDKMRHFYGINLFLAESSATRRPAPTPRATSRPGSSRPASGRRWASTTSALATRSEPVWAESSSSSVRG